MRPLPGKCVHKAPTRACSCVAVRGSLAVSVVSARASSDALGCDLTPTHLLGRPVLLYLGRRPTGSLSFL